MYIDTETLQTALLALLVLIQLRVAIGDIDGARWQRRIRPVRDAVQWVRARVRPEKQQQECDTCRQ